MAGCVIALVVRGTIKMLRSWLTIFTGCFSTRSSSEDGACAYGCHPHLQLGQPSLASAKDTVLGYVLATLGVREEGAPLCVLWPL